MITISPSGQRLIIPNGPTNSRFTGTPSGRVFNQTFTFPFGPPYPIFLTTTLQDGHTYRYLYTIEPDINVASSIVYSLNKNPVVPLLDPDGGIFFNYGYRFRCVDKEFLF